MHSKPKHNSVCEGVGVCVCMRDYRRCKMKLKLTTDGQREFAYSFTTKKKHIRADASVHIHVVT